MVCLKSCFENIFVTDKLNVTVNNMSHICGKKCLHKWRGSGHFWKITRQTFDKLFHFLPLGSLASLQTQRHLATKV
jgi:hypothetical protein